MYVCVRICVYEVMYVCGYVHACVCGVCSSACVYVCTLYLHAAWHIGMVLTIESIKVGSTFPPCASIGDACKSTRDDVWECDGAPIHVYTYI